LKISIVIVSYNVKYFLDLALKSALEASKNLDCEIFIVDNASSDGSVQFIEKYYPKDEFPSIKLLANEENLGFSKANNQAIKESKGEFILLLNPDTIIAEDTLTKSLDFMKNTPDAGALGVKMLDGSGKFLPESKRGLPTPKVSLYKMTGLSRLFPKSKRFGKYHLGFLDEDEINKVDVLSGAFMLLRKETLDKVGLLDETYFMYGEDIDLSYKITKGGYDNYYFPETSIIHFKGESTKKQSAHYVKIFYGAMQIFVKKHFGGSGAGIIAFLLSLAINLRAIFALVHRVIIAIALPLLDFAVLYLGFYAITKYWEHYNKWVKAIYPIEYYSWHIPIYILFLIISILISQGYRKPTSGKRIIRGILFGGILLFGLYGLAPKSLQFSRAILGLGIVWSMIGVILVRILIQFVKYGNIDIGSTEKKKSILIGNTSSLNSYLDHSERSFQKTEILGTVTIQDELNRPNILHLGVFKDLIPISRLYGINEFMMCINNVPYKTIIDCFIKNNENENIAIKLIDQEKQYVIGSNFKNKSGTLWTYGETPSYFNKETQNKKRVQDLLICLAIPVLLPIIIIRGKWELLKNIPNILSNKLNWVSPANNKHQNFPKTRQSVYNPTSILNKEQDTLKNRDNLDMEYLLNYDANKDLKIIWYKLLH
jgi:GT2 family glycosyltransferase